MGTLHVKAEEKGYAEPRIWTKPLRELTPETSLGFEVIDYAREVLHVELRPWQKWLLIHALELNEDGSYRFKKVIVLHLSFSLFRLIFPPWAWMTWNT